MAKISRQVASASQIVEIVAQSSSSNPLGLPLGSLAYNSSGLTCYYKRNTAAADVAVTLATITTLGTFTSGGFAAVDGTNMVGLYEFHVPNAALASGADTVTFCFAGASNLVPLFLEVELTGTSNQDAVHGGMSSLPNTACTANASLLTSGTGTDQISVSAGKLLLQATQTGVTIPTVTTVGTLTTYTGDTPQTGDAYARLGAPSGASIDADILTRLASSGYTAPPTSASIVTALWTDLTSSSDFATAGSVGALVKANTPQTGDSYGRIGLTGSGLTSLAPASTALSTTQWTNTRAGNLDNLDAAISTRSTYAGGAVASVTGGVGGNVTGSVGSVVGNVTGSVGSVVGNIGGNVDGNLLGTVFTLTTYTGNTPQTGDSFARLGAPAGASIDADILTRLASSSYTAPPTAAAIVTTLWTDLTSSSDFATAGSVGALVKANTPQTGDSYARMGVTGSGLTSLAPASTALSTAEWTNTRAGNLDNLDAAVSTRSTYAGGAVASVTGGVGGNVAGSVGSVVGNIAGSVGSVVGNVNGSVVGNVDGNVIGSVGSVVGNIGGNVDGNLLGTVSTLTTYTGNTPQTGDSYARIGLTGSGLTTLAPASTALSTAQWTNSRAGDLDNLDAAVSTRSTYAGGAVASVTGGVGGNVTGSVGSVVGNVGGNLLGTVSTLTTYTGNTPQTGDSFARIGSTGSGLTSLASSSTALSTAQWTSTRASNLDNLDAAVSTRSTYAGGAVASVTGSVGSIAGVTFPTLFSSLAIDASGRIDVGRVLGVASAGEAGYVGLDWGQVANLASTNNLSNTTISTGQTIQNVTGNVAGNVGGVSSAVTVGFSEDKTGYSLASSGLDSISVAAPMGVASTFPGMLIQVWRRFFKASAKSASTLTIETFADDGTTVVTTQGYTDDGAGTETLLGSS